MRADSTRKLFRDYGTAILIAVLIALLIRFFVIEAYRIPSQAMKPTLEAGDVIFVAKWPYGLRLPGNSGPLTQGRAPQRGDVVVFSLPSDPGKDYIKRVVGIPGDTVELKKGQLLLNGSPVTQPSEPNAVCGKETLPETSYEVCWEPPLLEDMTAMKIPDQMVFVVGDLRSQPTDPRKPKSWGLIPRSSVKSKALWIWLSIEPQSQGAPTSSFQRIQFERMFRSIR